MNYRQHLLMCLGLFASVAAMSIYADVNLTTQQAVDALYNEVVKKYNPYHAMQRMIKSNPEWVAWIAHQLNYLEQTPDGARINIEKKVSIIITEGNMRNVFVAYQQKFLEPYAAHCRDKGYDIHMQPWFMMLKARMAYPAEAFHFNRRSFHPHAFRHLVSLRDYQGWFADDYPGGNRVDIIAYITEIDSEQKHYRIDLTFCACKDSSVYQERMRS